MFVQNGRRAREHRPQPDKYKPVVAPVAAAAAPVKKAPKQLSAPNSDFYQLVDVSTAEENAVVKKVRTYMETKVQPIINRYFRSCSCIRLSCLTGPRAVPNPMCCAR
jgi:hypothetical protein